MNSFLLSIHPDLTPGFLVLFLVVAILLGMAKAGLSGLGLAIIPIMALIFGAKESTGVILPMLIAADIMAVTYWHRHAVWKHILKILPWAAIGIGVALFVGNSITDGAEWSELFNDLHIKNRGISGDNTSGILHRWQQIVDAKPKKVFLMIGTNDLSRGLSVDSVVKNILLAADFLKQESPVTQLYIQSILPVNYQVERKYESQSLLVVLNVQYQDSQRADELPFRHFRHLDDSYHRDLGHQRCYSQSI